MESHPADVEKANGSKPVSMARTPQSLAIQRTETHRKQHAETVGARKPAKLPSYGLNIGGGKPFPEPLPASSEYVVEFNDAHDPLHPQNWAIRRKYVNSMCFTFQLLMFLP